MSALNEYFRLITKTGQVEKCFFDASHHYLFGERMWEWSPAGTVRVALGLVNRWNRMANGEYIYWIEGV